MAFPISVALLAFPAILGLLPPHAMADYVLFTGEVLMAGQNLTNGQYRLAMQSNCDLILYEGENPIWGANIVGQDDDCYLGPKPNDELAVRRGVHYTLWSSSRKFKKGNYALVLDDNGRLGIYGQRRWTSGNQKELGLLDGSTVTTEYVLFSGDRLMPPRKLKYKNYGVEFMRCNLAIKDDQSGRFLWQTSTDGCSCYARQETDGELAVKHKGERLWGSNSKGSNGPYIAVLRFDGRLNVFGPLRWTHDGHHDSLSSNISFPSKI